jgi:hypothetical protein
MAILHGSPKPLGHRRPARCHAPDTTVAATHETLLGKTNVRKIPLLLWDNHQMVPNTRFYSIEAFGVCGLRLLLLPAPMGQLQKLMSLFQSMI